MKAYRWKPKMVRRLIAHSVVLSMASACGQWQLSGGRDGLSSEEWKRVQELRPLAVPAEASRFNEFWNDPGAAALGHKIFFDKEFSSPIREPGPSGAVGEAGRVACTNCHDPSAYFADARPTGGLSHGTSFSSRNSPSMVNVAYYDWFNWGGRRDSLAAQGAGTLETRTNGAGTRLQVAHRIFDQYREEYEALFGPLDPALSAAAPDAARFPPEGRPKASGDPDGPWEGMAEADRQSVNLVMANIGKSFEAYERNLVSGDSPFSRYLDDADAPDFSAAARRGLVLFVGKGACNDCHRGPILSDNLFHNIGVPQAVGDNAPPVDTGRFQDVPRLLSNAYNTAGVFSADPEAGREKLSAADPDDESTRGEFRTAGLLNVAETAPYFHNGSVATLEEVVQHYNRGGGELGTFSGVPAPQLRPLGLSDEEVRDLVEFLRSLTGEPVPERWRRDPLAVD